MALVTELKKERRHAVLLTVVGLVILAILVIVFLNTLGEENVPITPAGRAANAVREQASAPPAEPVTTVTPATGIQHPAVPPDKPEEDTPQAPELEKPATVRLMLTKKTILTIDGKAVARAKQNVVEVPAGKRQVKLKLGKRSATQTVEFAGGAEYELRFDPKNEKALLKKLK